MMVASKVKALSNLYEASMHVCGDVIELGVGAGESFIWWMQDAQASDRNPARHFYGFDTFEGFPHVAEEDGDHAVGEENHGDYCETIVTEGNAHLVRVYYGDTPRVKLIKGDICETLPVFFDDHPWVIPALVYLDCDVYEPTLAAMLTLIPRMPKYSILAFDEVGFSRWHGETRAMYDGFEQLGIPFNTVALERCPYYLASAVIIGNDTGRRIWT